MSKGTLSFQVELPMHDIDYIDLPVEIRQPNYSLVARALCSESIDLDPGTYFVSTTLPSGQQWLEQVQVESGEETSVHLTPDPEEGGAFAYDWQGLAKGVNLPSDISFAEEITGRRMRSARHVADEGKVRLITGNVLQGEFAISEPDKWTQSRENVEGRAQWRVPGSNENQFAQLIQPDRPALNVALPTGGGNECRLNLTRLPEGHYTLDVQLEHHEADMLLRYRERGFLKEAAAMAGSQHLTAERLLYQKVSHPIAAAVGAYALLRFGELERLHDWTENLRNWFSWLPDGLTIRAEHLARLGQHEEALALLVELPARGLPYFSEGLTYAVDRLRLYLTLGEKGPNPALVAPASALLRQLQQYASNTDFNKPILTFTGLTPTQPDAATLNLETVEDEEGLYIPDYLL